METRQMQAYVRGNVALMAPERLAFEADDTIPELALPHWVSQKGITVQQYTFQTKV